MTDSDRNYKMLFSVNDLVEWYGQDTHAKYTGVIKEVNRHGCNIIITDVDRTTVNRNSHRVVPIGNAYTGVNIPVHGLKFIGQSITPLSKFINDIYVKVLEEKTNELDSNTNFLFKTR